MENSNNQEKKKKELKVILLGDAGVGKSSIILRYYQNKFNENGVPTFGASYVIKEVEKKEIIFKLNIWDTSGQEKYRSVTKLFVQGASIVILVFSVDRPESFQILDFWYKEVLKICQGEENFILGVLGNKSDLLALDIAETIPEEEAIKYAKEKNALFKFVSAKEDYKGIETYFNSLLDKCIERNIGTELENSFKIRRKTSKKEKKPKASCC